jgi:cytoskeleton protein RodZ
MGERKRSYFSEREQISMVPDESSPVGGNPVIGSPVGTLLRNTREQSGYGLRDVAAALRIREAYLQAIEDGRFDDLPGPTYVAGFLRTYAEHLGLDPQEIVRRYKEQSADVIRKAELYVPQPVPEGRIPGGAMLLVGVLLAAGVYGGWFYVTSTGRNLVDLVPALPDRLASALNIATVTPSGDVVTTGPAVVRPAETAVAAAPVVEQRPQAPVARVPVPEPVAVAPVPQPVKVPPAVASTPASTSVPVESAEEEEEPMTTATPLAELQVPHAAPAPVSSPSLSSAAAATAAPPPPPAPPAAAADGRVYGVTNGPSRIQIRAVQDSWIQIRDSAGDLLIARVLRPGDTYRAPDQPGLKLVTGNAGGLTVLVDGVAGPAIGAPGQVMRDVLLDPQRLIGTPRAN